LQCVPTGFATFIRDPVCGGFVDHIVGGDNDVAVLLAELRQRLPARVRTRQQLRKWVGYVWLPSTIHPVKRGRSYWQRCASIIWKIYTTTADLRRRTKKAIQKEMERIARADERRCAKMLAARERRRARREVKMLATCPHRMTRAQAPNREASKSPSGHAGRCASTQQE